MNELYSSWNQFFFSKHSPAPVAVCRIMVAIVFLYALLLLSGDLSTWYGDNSAVTLLVARKVLPIFPSISFLCLPGANEQVVFAVYYLAIVSGVSLALGWHSRISAIFSFVIFQSFLRRNPFILSGSDELLSQMIFYLILSDAGMLFSVDRLLASKKIDNIPIRTAPWAQRLLQMQLCLIYLYTFIVKAQQADWQNGSALQKVFQTRELRNFPVPDFITHNQSICQFLTWSTLGIEIVLPILLWVRPIRNYVVVFGIAFHLCMEYCLNIPMFQPLMIACLICFLEPFSILRVFVRLRRLFRLSKKAKT